MTPTPPAAPVVPPSIVASFMAAVHLDQPDSLKRFLVFIFGTAATLLINPFLISKGMPAISDANLLAAAGIVAGFLLQSGANAGLAKLADAHQAGIEAASSITTPELAAAFLRGEQNRLVAVPSSPVPPPSIPPVVG